MRRKTEIYKETINRTFKFFKNTLQELEDDEVIKEVELLVESLDKRVVLLKENTLSIEAANTELEELKDTLARCDAEVQRFGTRSYEAYKEQGIRNNVIKDLEETQQLIQTLTDERTRLIQSNKDDFKNLCVIMAKEDQNALLEINNACNRLGRSLKPKTFQQQFEEAAEGFLSCLIEIISLGGNMVHTCDHTIYRHDTNTYEGEILVDNGETLRISVNVNKNSIVIADQNLQLIGQGNDFRNINWKSGEHRNDDIIRMYRELTKVKAIMRRRDQKFKGKQKMQHVLVNA